MPTFDRATGQLVVQRALVRKTREQEDEEDIRRLHSTGDAPSTKRQRPMQRFADKDGVRSVVHPMHPCFCRPISLSCQCAEVANALKCVSCHGRCSTSYFRDDASDLQQLVESERRGTASTGYIDVNLADSIARSKRFKGLDVDDEYDHDVGIEMSDSRSARQSDAQKEKHASSAASMERKRRMSAAERAEARFSRHKHLVVAIGNYVYLRAQDAAPLATAHLVIEPIDNTASLVDATEEVSFSDNHVSKHL